MESIEFIDLGAQRRRLGDSIDRAIARVLDHGQFIMGPEVRELEDRLASYCGAGNAVTCASGTDALLLPLMAWGIGPGDAVIVPSFTFAATAEVVALLRATPVFVDVLPDSFNIDPESARRGLDAARAVGLRPVGIIAVDMFGLPADHASLRAIAADAGLWLLADAAQSVGASVGEMRVGTMGDVTATSFFPAKPLGCYGDGGAIFTDDDDLAAVLRSLRVHGSGDDKYQNIRIGVNGRLDTIQAAILLEKLRLFDDELEARQAVATSYSRQLRDAVMVPTVPPGTVSAWAQYTIRLSDRDRSRAVLAERGIPTAVYYPKSLHQQPAYAHALAAPGDLRVSTTLAAEVLSLPMHPYLSEELLGRISDEVVAVVTGSAGG